ncbi:MAG: 3TM-type holin [Candidatus Neomarinimicrobiota bacterium]|nr:3TM-type holin [Candidatus Neomarinimicrobiota bacterium]|tara:strand:- start:15370 stop:15765 length:396 start_codon:yes stop_codon:yes gene_type:complete
MLTALIGPVTSLLDKFIEDKDQKAKLAHELSTMAEKHAQELAKGQLEINKAEAGHKSIFVAGWRPFIGWTCGVALAWHFVIAPFIMFFSAYFGLDMPALPDFDMGSLLTVLMGMLGLGGLRTFEKYKGITK